jgi:uncharacterized repeat protein (TIGR03803 family)
LFGFGTVWKLTSSGTETVLYNFSGTDGANPAYGKIGNLYGVTAYGGPSNDGVIFRITTGGSFSVLHNFTGADGSLPYGTPVQDGNGNLYGTAAQGGSYGGGTVWKLTSTAVLTVLHHFAGGWQMELIHSLAWPETVKEASMASRTTAGRSDKEQYSR